MDEAKESKYYLIGEVAERFGVSTAVISYWESQFDTVKPGVSHGGVRHFTQQDIEALNTVYFLIKIKGYTIKGAKDALKRPHVHTKIELISRLEKAKQFLQDLSQKLDEQVDEPLDLVTIKPLVDKEPEEPEPLAPPPLEKPDVKQLDVWKDAREDEEK